jgi:hypothetical protein
MNDNTVSKLGGNSSILLGISYLVIGVTYLLPAAQKQTSATDQFLPSFAENPTTQVIQWWVFALNGLIGIAVVLAESESLRPANEGWVRWTSTLAILGFAVVSINNFRVIAFQPAMARAHVEGDAVTKAAIEVSGPSSLDPQGWLGFGAVGLWVLVVSLLALRVGAWPTLLAYIGIATALAYRLIVAGFVFNQETLSSQYVSIQKGEIS